MPSEKDYTLGFLVDQSALLDTTEIPEGFFKTEKQRGVWDVISKLRAAGEVVNAFTIGERCAGNGVVSYIDEITSGIYRIKPEDFRRRVLKQAADEVKARIISEVQRESKSGVFDYDGILSMVEEARRLELEAEGEIDGRAAADLLSTMYTGTAMQTLDLKVEYDIAQLVPARSITLLHSKSGVGKTWLCLQAAKAVSEGREIFSLATKQRPVFYADYENPLPLMSERTRILDVGDGVRFWHLSGAIRPPKLDGPDWTLYKQLPAGSLIIIDTARACQDGDENSSQDVGLVMGRLKELREQGQTIILEHHTGKADERNYKGSTAWADLADHVLALYRVRRGTFEEVDDDAQDLDTIFSLGTGAKTRFAPARIFLRFDPTRGFSLAEDPDSDQLAAIRAHVLEAGRGLNQSQLFEWARTSTDVHKKATLVFLLKKGERLGLWTSSKYGRERAYYAA